MRHLDTAAAAFARLSAPVRSAFWMLVVGVAISAVLAIVRHIADDIHVFEIVFFRSLFGIVFMAPWLMRRGMSALSTTRPGLIAGRGVLAYIGGACLFFGATMMPLADIMAITFTRPIIATLAAILFLHEVVRVRRWSAILIGFAGTLIIVRPGYAGSINPGILFVFGAVLAQTWNTINMKVLTATEPPDTIAIYHPIVILPLSLIATLFVWTTPSVEQLLWMFAIGVLEILSQRAISRAYAPVDTSLIMAFAFTRLPVAALIGFLVFGEVPAVWVWIGGAVITASAVYIAHREAVLAGRRNAPESGQASDPSSGRSA